MSEFIKSKQHLFTRKEIFYEFDQDEDLLYCKDIVLMKKKWIREGLKLEHKVSTSGVIIHVIVSQ